MHVAVSNAGITESASSALDITPREWDQVYEVNTKGSFLFCRACAQNMIDHGVKGSIVTLSTLMARSGKGMSGAYASSKAAVIMFTKTLAKCLAPMGIRVNCVSPGVVATDIYNRVEAEMMMEQGTLADWLVEESIENGQLLIPRGCRRRRLRQQLLFWLRRMRPILRPRILASTGAWTGAGNDMKNHDALLCARGVVQSVF